MSRLYPNPHSTAVLHVLCGRLRGRGPAREKISNSKRQTSPEIPTCYHMLVHVRRKNTRFEKTPPYQVGSRSRYLSLAYRAYPNDLSSGRGPRPACALRSVWRGVGPSRGDCRVRHVPHHVQRPSRVRAHARPQQSAALCGDMRESWILFHGSTLSSPPRAVPRSAGPRFQESAVLILGGSSFLRRRLGCFHLSRRLLRAIGEDLRQSRGEDHTDERSATRRAVGMGKLQ